MADRIIQDSKVAFQIIDRVINKVGEGKVNITILNIQIANDSKGMAVIETSTPVLTDRDIMEAFEVNRHIQSKTAEALGLPLSTFRDMARQRGLDVFLKEK